MRREMKLLLAVGDEGWEADASCRSASATLFFGPNRFEPKHERIAREEAAKAVCATCPVIQPCREHALLAAEPYGVWGGLGEGERRTLLERSHPVTATAV